MERSSLVRDVQSQYVATLNQIIEVTASGFQSQDPLQGQRQSVFTTFAKSSWLPPKRHPTNRVRNSSRSKSQDSKTRCHPKARTNLDRSWDANILKVRNDPKDSNGGSLDSLSTNSSGERVHGTGKRGTTASKNVKSHDKARQGAQTLPHPRRCSKHQQQAKSSSTLNHKPSCSKRKKEDSRIAVAPKASNPNSSLDVPVLFSRGSLNHIQTIKVQPKAEVPMSLDPNTQVPSSTSNIPPAPPVSKREEVSEDYLDYEFVEPMPNETLTLTTVPQKTFPQDYCKPNQWRGKRISRARRSLSTSSIMGRQGRSYENLSFHPHIRNRGTHIKYIEIAFR
ncbi:hypothetical protein TCAL_08866 [Tigriopus californicus]|uniref:Uncharacterized protein n=1 Tax=Tigriopus californicus TaxID=6832 RepID=A0A553N761_TIGCA|nr:hypothetical protein TCAL_08866 [Tigriopus californicus]